MTTHIYDNTKKRTYQGGHFCIPKPGRSIPQRGLYYTKNSIFPHGLERLAIGNGAIGRHATGDDVDKNHEPRLKLGCDRRIRVPQLFSHGLEGAVVAVDAPARHRHRVDSRRASAAENLQLSHDRQAGVRVDRSRASRGVSSGGFRRPEAGSLELELPMRIAERPDDFLLGIVAMPNVTAANPFGDLASAGPHSDRSTVQVGCWRFAGV